MKWPRLLPGFIALGLVLTASAAPTDPLESGFASPPDLAKPQTWWHWMNGNISKPGITADLEAMKQIGLGGATIVNVDCGIPSGSVPFMSPEWQDDFKFAVQEADRLGFKLCVENCAGWSSSGGPWNTPTNAMQRLTSSEIKADGPARFDAVLPQPAVNLDFYRDIAVLAFKVAEATNPPAAGAGQPPGKLEIKSAFYESKEGGAGANVTAKVVALIQDGHKSIDARSDELGGDPASGEVKQLRVQLLLDGKPATVIVDEGDTLTLPATWGELAALQSIGRTSAKRTFVQPPPAAAPADGSAVPLDQIVDLTTKLDPDGHLRWNVPRGKWIILRLGYTPIGVNNHPAPKEGTGLECDKLSKTALDAHWAGFMQKVLDDVGPLAGKSLNASLIDSYEVGGQDWTGDFRAEFQKRRGYDPLKFLVTFTGRVVDNPPVTERFLWDMRRTVADLFAENYYAHFAELCREHGLLSAVEPYTGPFESLQCGKAADVVMGEFWTGSQGHPSVKMAASIAHIYGKPVVGAESFTASGGAGKWQNDPYSLKTLGDLMYCQGLNRYYFHRYAMQPWTNRWPGMTMGEFGFHFERTLTWWKQGKAWIDYISRCEFMLQQGRAVNDAAYFTGESAPVEMRVGNPALPAGYDFDAINADVLLHGATVKNGRITLASGANYGVLILPPGDTNMTPQLLRRIGDLARAGATVVGARPQHSPSLAGFPECDEQVKKYGEELWGECNGTSVQENQLHVSADGSAATGRIVWGKPLAKVFAEQKLKPDFEFPAADGRLAYTHRVAGDADIYFVSNQRRQFDSVECTFRVSGKIPELWHPDTGLTEAAPVWSAQDGRTTVRVNLDPAGSVFIVFRRTADQAEHVTGVVTTIGAGSASSPKLVINQAIYEATDGAGEMNVTAKLAELARGGQLVVAANNDTLGRDPAENHNKVLRVDYTLDDKPGEVTVRENETLTLPSAPSIGLAPQWEASVGTDGVSTVKLWRNGDVNLQTEAGAVLHATANDVPAPREITGEWNLSFPANWGAPMSVTLQKLVSWTDHPDNGVRYFSGTAAYSKTIELGADRLKSGRELWLDLGTVKNFAEVSLNGQDLGVLWKPPFRANLTGAAHPGANALVVKVTNLWPNRLIGDEQLPADCEWDGDQLKAWPQWLLENKPSPTGRLTFTTWHHWKKDSALLESGLLGPVTLRTAELISAK